MPLQIVRQDITRMQVDAIVNSTDSRFSGSGGVDLAIRSAAGKELDAALAAYGRLEQGESVYTSGYGLPAKYIIHTAAPAWKGYDSEIWLKRCYIKALETARELECESVALPLLASGRLSCPRDKALQVATSAIQEFLQSYEMQVYLVVYDSDSYRLSRRLVREVISYIDDNYIGDAEVSLYSSARLGERSDDISSPDGMELYRSLPRQSRSPLPSDQYSEQELPFIKKPPAKRPDLCAAPPEQAGHFFAARKAPRRRSLEEMIKNMDDSFPVALMKLIDAKGMEDVTCYKNANISKQTWYKIQSEKDYRPSKQTVLCFAISLRLTLAETEALLRTAGLALSDSQLFDVIVRYFIEEGIYDIYEINNTLFSFDQRLLC